MDTSDPREKSKAENWWAEGPSESGSTPVFEPQGAAPADGAAPEPAPEPQPTQVLPAEQGGSQEHPAGATLGPGQCPATETPVEPAVAAVQLAPAVQPTPGPAASEGTTPEERAAGIAAEATPGAVPQEPPLPSAAALVGAGFSFARAMQQGQAATRPLDSTAMVVLARTPKRVRRGQVIPLKEARTVLGQGRGAGCLLDDPAVADYHAVITYESRPGESGYYLYPGAGMKHNGQTPQVAVRLTSGDRLGIGASELVFLTVDLM